MWNAIPHDRLTGQGEYGIGSNLGIDLKDIAHIGHAHSPEDVVAQENQRIQSRHDHLLAQAIPTAVTLGNRQLRNVFQQFARRTSILRYRNFGWKKRSLHSTLPAKKAHVIAVSAGTPVTQKT